MKTFFSLLQKSLLDSCRVYTLCISFQANMPTYGLDTCFYRDEKHMLFSYVFESLL